MSTLRRVVVMAGAICLSGVLVAPRTADSATTSGTSTAGSAQITFLGRAKDGSEVRIREQLSEIALSNYSPSSPAVAAGRGSAYLSFYAAGGTSDDTRPAFDGIDGVGTSAVHLVLPDGTVVPAQQPMSPQGNLLLGSYYFLVPSSIKRATLEVSPGSYGAVEYPNGVAAGGELTTIAFDSSKTVLVVPPPPHKAPPIRKTPTSTAPPRTKAASSKATRSTGKTSGGSVGFVSPLDIGVTSGAGVVILVLLIPIWRRRAYRRADAAGRVVIDSPPLLLSPRIPPASDRARELDTPPNVVVKVLGPVEIDGLVEPIKMSPVREVLVFLALHPGRSFTTIELRSSIWVEGRNEPSSATFRNYLTDLRKSLPPETLTRDGYHYALIGAVTTDWGCFTALSADDARDPELLSEALSLIRGTPFEGASSGRNSPYGWSGEIAHRMEVAVERAAHELAAFGLESGDPAFADVGVTQALRCVPTSFVVRGDHIRLGMVVGGRKELERRMQAARSALGDDAATLEPVARGLGWEVS
jgi:hypothetical protein